MRATLNALSAAVLVIVGMAGLFSISTARAVEVDTDFGYTGAGSETRTLFDETSSYVNGEVDFGGIIGTIDFFPGAIQFRASLTTTTTATVDVPTDVHVSAPDGGVVEGETIPVTTTNVPKDGPQNEFKLDFGAELTLAADYDADEDGTACPLFAHTDPDAGTSDDTCITLTPDGTITIFNESMVAPYRLDSRTFSDSKTLFSLKVCQLVFGLDVCSIDLIGTVHAELSATEGGSVTTAGFHADRDIVIGGTPSGSTTAIAWPSSAQVVDNVKIACGGSPGSSVSYLLKDNSYDTQLINAAAGFKIDISLYIDLPDPIGHVGTSFTILDLGSLIPLQDNPIPVLASDDDYQVTLGTLVAEQTPPEIGANGGAPNPGTEGSPVTFTAAATDNCPGALSYRWDFSDGGVAFGPTANHTFADNGAFTYQLSVRDLRGNTAIANGSEQVNNAGPIANAGPDALEAWGRNLPFNGQAVDPGANDQSTLSYEWDFGDNSPKGHAKDVMHAYTTPGTYIATLTVCDKDGACDSDSRSVDIRRRNTSLGYLGSHTWTYDTQVQLTGSLVDEFGQMVNGRQIDFSIDGGAAASGNTNSAGIADRSYQVSQTAGGHGVGAAFSGDALYAPSSSTDASVVVLKATSVAYTGSLTGGPNKTITLSAILKDSEGKPLGGRQIDFVLGSQTTSAVTDAVGVATTTLKLNQKNGTYNLKATYVPIGTDTGKYSGSSTAATFKLQAK